MSNSALNVAFHVTVTRFIGNTPYLTVTCGEYVFRTRGEHAVLDNNVLYVDGAYVGHTDNASQWQREIGEPPLKDRIAERFILGAAAVLDRVLTVNEYIRSWW